MKKLVLAVVAAAVLCLPQPARAQTPSSPGDTTTRPTYEFGLGYQYLHTGQFCAGFDESTCNDDDPKSFPVGIVLDGVRNWGAFGLVGEFGWSHRDDDSDDPFGDHLSTDVLHAGLGIRFTGHWARFWPYAQLLGGATYSRFDGQVAGLDFRDSRGRWMAQGGGGITFVTGDGWGLFLDAAYRRVVLDEEEDFTSGRNDVRAVFGVRMILD